MIGNILRRSCLRISMLLLLRMLSGVLS